MSDETAPVFPKEAQDLLDRMRAAEASCDIHITVGGQLTPLRDCDWVLRRPCGHASGIMSAVQMDDVYPNAASAWPEMYSAEPSPYVRTRDREIRAMQSAGWTVEIMLRDDAVKAHRDSFRFCKKGCGEPKNPTPPPSYTATTNPEMGARRVRIMLKLAHGIPVKQIARREGLTYEQVRADLAVMRKNAGVGTRLELVLFALRSGELPAEDVGIEIPSGVLTPPTGSESLESYS